MSSAPPSSTEATAGFSLERRFTLGRAREWGIQGGLFLCALLSILTTLGIVFILFNEAVYSVTGGRAFFQLPEVSLVQFLTGTEWHYEDGKYGILPLVWGTILIAGIAAVIGLPIGIASAVYLSEYATPRTRSFLKPTLELLAGVPSVVFGYFALVLITPYVLEPIFEDLLGLDVDIFNAAAAGIVVGIMIIPTVCSLSEDALRAVPRSLREAGYALGSTKFDVSARIVLPAAFSGIVASFLLAMARAIGETMAVVMAAGHLPNVSPNPFHPHQTMTSYIVNVATSDVAAGSPEYQSLYAVALVLFAMTLVMNLVSQSVMRRFREVYQ